MIATACLQPCARRKTSNRLSSTIAPVMAARMTDTPSAVSSDAATDDHVVRIASRGEGVTASGRHVAAAAPGDRVLADGTIIAGPHHQTPPCRHYGQCGACQLQHIDDAAFATYLTDRVVGGLRGQGLAVPHLRSPHLSPPYSRRRASLKAERRGRDVILGFNQERSHRVVDVRGCHVLAPALLAVFGPLRRALADLMPRRGGGASVQLTLADQGIDIVLGGLSADGLEAHDALMRLAETTGVARIAIDDGSGPEDRFAPEPVTITLGGYPVALPHNAFLQATPDGEAALVAAVRDAIGGAAAVADLFAGLGTFAFALADGRSVHAVEARRDAVLALQGAANRGVLRVTSDHRDLYRRPLTAAELARFDAVIIDPPRAGAEQQARELAASRVAVIAAVSCNPASFARDAAILITGGYALDWVQPVGQFRWSTHVELAARFSR